jgi:hypothetical protein
MQEERSSASAVRSQPPTSSSAPYESQSLAAVMRVLKVVMLGRTPL